MDLLDSEVSERVVVRKKIHRRLERIGVGADLRRIRPGKRSRYQ
jgi:hypothetical protein